MSTNILDLENDIKNQNLHVIYVLYGEEKYLQQEYLRKIKKVFGEQAKDVKVNSTKSMIGHLLGAAGAVEFITCVKSIQEGFVHQTVGYQVPDEECDLDYVTEGPLEMDVKYALSNSLGFGGHNATLLVKRFED